MSGMYGAVPQQYQGMPQVNPYPFQGLNPNVRHRPLLDAIMAGGQFLGNLGQFANGAAQLGDFITGGQGLQGNLLQSILGGGGGNKPRQGGGRRQGDGGGGGAPFGTQGGNYGPLTGAVLRHTPQSILMNTGGPMYQVARDFYLGPSRPSFSQAH